ncbi:MAG: transglycosylase SLT domain-containing protein [Bdellovibrionota bacterium]
MHENIHYLFWNSKKVYSSLPEIVDFKDKGSEYDTLIQFWIDYWKSQGVPFPDDLDPLMIKALIAVESTFNPNARSKVKGSTAEGLMQVTDQSLRILGGFPNKKGWIEMRKQLNHVEKAEKLDPIINVALGTRLLGHKFSQITDNSKRNSKTMIAHYNSRGKEGDAYAQKVLEFYKKSKKVR